MQIKSLEELQEAVNKGQNDQIISVNIFVYNEEIHEKFDSCMKQNLINLFLPNCTVFEINCFNVGIIDLPKAKEISIYHSYVQKINSSSCETFTSDFTLGLREISLENCKTANICSSQGLRSIYLPKCTYFKCNEIKLISIIELPEVTEIVCFSSSFKTIIAPKCETITFLCSEMKDFESETVKKMECNSCTFKNIIIPICEKMYLTDTKVDYVYGPKIVESNVALPTFVDNLYVEENIENVLNLFIKT